MNLDQIELCSENYQKWKAKAFLAKDINEAKKCLEKAFFWLELQTAFITLFAAEKISGNDQKSRLKLITAKANLSKKLAEYAEETLKEIKFT